MKMIFNIWSSIFDIIAPRACTICGKRLSLSEAVICATCNLHLNRTNYHLSPYDNELARCFWGKIPIERCAAYLFYQHHTQSSKMVYALKYGNRPDIGVVIGKTIAEAYARNNFFEDIDALLPIPLSKDRLKQRGYNQSEELARGISETTHLPILTNVLRRNAFHQSQTKLDRWQRNENVKDVFSLINAEKISGKHILIIDDIITTGATITAVGEELLKAEGVKISICSLGYAKD